MELEDILKEMSLEEYWEQLARVMQDFFATRYTADGSFRLGTTPECLKIPEFDAYFEGKISNRRRQRYDSHIAGCDDCMGMIEEFREYAAEHPFRFMARRTISLPYRFMDYIHERNQAQLGPQESSAGAYRQNGKI